MVLRLSSCSSCYSSGRLELGDGEGRRVEERSREFCRGAVVRISVGDLRGLEGEEEQEIVGIAKDRMSPA